MANYEYVHTEGNDPKFNMPYSAAIAVTGGKIVFLAGVTAAPVYHSHPHVPEEFADIPTDPEEQASMAMENLKSVVEAAGGDLSCIVEVTRYLVDTAANQNGVNRAMNRAWGDHRPASTSVEIVRLATDPRLVVELRAVAVVPA